MNVIILAIILLKLSKRLIRYFIISLFGNWPGHHGWYYIPYEKTPRHLYLSQVKRTVSSKDWNFFISMFLKPVQTAAQPRPAALNKHLRTLPFSPDMCHEMLLTSIIDQCPGSPCEIPFNLEEGWKRVHNGGKNTECVAIFETITSKPSSLVFFILSVHMFKFKLKRDRRGIFFSRKLKGTVYDENLFLLFSRTEFSPSLLPSLMFGLPNISGKSGCKMEPTLGSTMGLATRRSA